MTDLNKDSDIAKTEVNSPRTPAEALQGMIAKQKRQIADLRNTNNRLRQQAARPSISYMFDGSGLNIRETKRDRGRNFHHDTRVLDQEKYKDLLRVIRPMVEFTNHVLKGRDVTKSTQMTVKGPNGTRVPKLDENSKPVFTRSSIEMLDDTYSKLLKDPNVLESLATICDVIDQIREHSEANRSTDDSPASPQN